MTSETTLRALRIIRDNPRIRPREFAHHMWPDSDGWRRPCKSGAKGNHQGGGMYLAAGGYLGRLRKMGLIETLSMWTHASEARLTAKGRLLLEEEADQPLPAVAQQRPPDHP